jgi:nucleotide-binding universal stress UspA family protein
MGAGYSPELQDSATSAKDLLTRAAKFLAEAGFKAETLLREGDVRETILDTAQEWKADLIVIGSRGRSGVQRLLLGSVAEPVARHAPCSVEIVRVLNSYWIARQNRAGAAASIASSVSSTLTYPESSPTLT